VVQLIDALLKALAGLLAVFYGFIPSYGAAIALFTLAIMTALSPLTLKQTRSMLSMQRLQPEIKRLQKEHKGDRVALNEAQMALFKEHGVNPLSGCLPMVLQAPVFSVLYWVLKGLTAEVGGAKAAALKAAGLCQETAAKCINPKYLSSDTRLFRDLVRGGGRMMSFGVDLAQSATAHHANFLSALPYYFLVAGAVAASYFQMKRMYARNPQALANNPQAAMMNRIFPVMTGMISLNLPAGIALYFVISNLFRIGQQEAMYRWDPHVSKHAKELAHEAEQKVEDKKASDRKVIQAKSTPKPDKRDDETAPPKRQPWFGARPKAEDAEDAGAKKAPSNGTPGPNGARSPNGRAQPKGSQGSRNRKRRGKRGR
jgi:YidC/Oxa1 family membrane protein insertase